MKIGTSNPQSCLREISKEVAQRAGELRGMHSSRRDADRSGQRKLDPRYRGGFLSCVEAQETANAEPHVRMRNCQA